MTVSFAPARCAARSPVARVLARRAPSLPGNDPGDDLWHEDAPLAAALLHFARHGLSAARTAREKAEAAHRNGDPQAAGEWLAICRALDKRQAADLERRIAIPSAPAR